MPSKQSYQMQYCQCISRRCGEVEYIDKNGQLQHGNKIFQHLCRVHQLEDERARATSADPIEEPQAPDMESNPAANPLNALIERLRLSTTRDHRPSSQSAVAADHESLSLTRPGLHHVDFNSSQSSSSSVSAREVSSLEPSSVQMTSREVDHSTTNTFRNQQAEPDQLDPNIPVYDTSTFIHLRNTFYLCSQLISAESKPISNLPDHCLIGLYMENQLATANPVLIFPLLITALLVVFENISLFTANWLLNVLHAFTVLVNVHGTGSTHEATEPVTFLDQLVLDELPRDIRTVFSNFQLEPDLLIFNSCPRCFALYHTDHTPKTCTHGTNEVPGLFKHHQQPREGLSSDEPDITCSEPLFKESRDTTVPARQYAVQNLHTWISRLVSRQGIEDALDKSLTESRKPYNANDQFRDIHQSYEWKKFRDDDGTQFTAHSGNLTFGMFIDGINPFGNKTSGHKVSITFIVLVCLTLPISIRYLPENLFLAGIAPGPKEPSLEQSNHILSPVVTQLQSLWDEGIYLNQTPSHPNGRRIHAALLVLIADLPALRGALGFASHTAKNFCSFCFLTNKEIENLDPDSWVRRTSSQHRKLAFSCRDAEDPHKREDIFKKFGVRYSVLNELSCLKLIDSQVVDSMHNLLLGLLQRHCRSFWSMTDQEECDGDPPASNVPEVRELVRDLARKARDMFIPKPQDARAQHENQFQNMEFGTNTSSNDPDFELQGWEGEWVEPSDPDEIVFDKAMLKKINTLLPRIHIPTWINRPIRSLGNASFGKLKADEWRNLFTIKLPLLLTPIWSNGDQRNHSLLKNLVHLSSLVNLGLKRTMTRDRINNYRHHLKQYLEGVLILFPHSDLVTNHHMAFHLAECLERFGPVRAWWCFPFERLMGGILKSGHNNHVGKFNLIVFQIPGLALSKLSLTNHFYYYRAIRNDLYKVIWSFGEPSSSAQGQKAANST